MKRDALAKDNAAELARNLGVKKLRRIAGSALNQSPKVISKWLAACKEAYERVRA